MIIFFFVNLCFQTFLVGANDIFVQDSEDKVSLSVAIKSITENLMIKSNRVDLRIYGTNKKLPELDEILAETRNFPIEVKRFSSKLT